MFDSSCRGFMFTYNDVQHDFHIRRCSCRLTVTRWVSLMEQELLTFPEVFVGVRVAQFFIFCVVFWRLLFSFSHCVVCPSLYVFRLPTLVLWNFYNSTTTLIKHNSHLVPHFNKLYLNNILDDHLSKHSKCVFFLHVRGLFLDNQALHHRLNP